MNYYYYNIILCAHFFIDMESHPFRRDENKMNQLIILEYYSYSLGVRAIMFEAIMYDDEK